MDIRALSLLVKLCLIKCAMCLLSCSEGDLQLNNSTSPPLVMLCVQGQWGYVCGREASNSPWTQENVGVACQQLGFIREASDVQIPRLDDPISSMLPVHYRFVYCTGVERRLIDCAHGESPTNGHAACRRGGTYRYGTVACSQQPVICVAGELKIINNTLMICSQGEWYTLCGDTDSWTQAQARVACRQMGLNPNGSSASSLMSTSHHDFQLLSAMFHCIGSEASLKECSSSVIQCSELAVLTCGEVQTVEGSSSSISTVMTEATTIRVTPTTQVTRSIEISGSKTLQLLSTSSLSFPLPWIIGLIVGIATGATITAVIWIIHVKRKRSCLKIYDKTTKVSDRPRSTEQQFSMTSNPTYIPTWKRDKVENANMYEVPITSNI